MGKGLASANEEDEIDSLLEKYREFLNTLRKNKD